ncbi:MAG: outer membrane beta-barrel protein [Flavobacteriaceae bacterium]|nr:outer membrane beta-barrel protein [Flavobacteriaceae bacterium]
MKKTLILGSMVFAALQANAQVKDVSVTLQPTASYNWFDDNTAIEDGVMIGGRVGFGFGEALEIRGIYEKSIDLKNTIEGIDFLNDDIAENFESRDVNVERIGGEFKANIPTGGSLAPYITLGTGVQKLSIENFGDTGEERKSENIYASAGLGFKVNLSDRITLNLEGKNTIFNMDPSNVLFIPESNDDFQDWIGDDKNTRMYNWSVLAGLQLYLGGREPGKMTELDRAYYRKFSGGLGGFKFSIEPGGSYINFNDKTNFKDTYLVGAQAGFDLNQYVGLRGYYYQATKDEKISTDWDDLAIYGGDVVAKLNVARGLVPYITLGGGYINAYDSYVGKDELTGANSGYFAKGGVGLNIPVTPNLELFGSANLMYTTDRQLDDLQNTLGPDELMQHTMYNAGIRFQIGKSANAAEVAERRISSRVDERTRIYQDRIDALEDELAEAYRSNDTEKAVQIIEEKKELENKQEEVIREGVSTTDKKVSDDESRVKMTPAELESLVEKVIQGVDQEEVSKPQSTEERIDRLERLLLEINSGANRGTLTPAQTDLASDRIMNRLDQLNSKIDNNTAQINRLAGSGSDDKTVIVTQGGTQPTVLNPGMNQVPAPVVTKDGVVSTDGTVKNEERGIATGFFVNQGMSIFGGFAFGDDSAGLVGIRGHYAITNSPIGFMPDLYVAPGDKTGFGVNANAILGFENIVNTVIAKPYIGLGIGYNNVGDFDKFGTNFIIGTSFNVLGGNLYADYTGRGFIDLSQISVGYRFGF